MTPCLKYMVSQWTLLKVGPTMAIFVSSSVVCLSTGWLTRCPSWTLKYLALKIFPDQSVWLVQKEDISNFITCSYTVNIDFLMGNYLEKMNFFGFILFHEIPIFSIVLVHGTTFVRGQKVVLEYALFELCFLLSLSLFISSI